MASETIVINDILFLLACKYSYIPSHKLLKAIQEHFGEDTIVDACETLQESVLEPLADPIRKPKSIPKALEAIISYLGNTHPDERPTFVCRNLNGLPKFSRAKCNKKSSKRKRVLKEEYVFMKSKITEISTIICQLREQLHSVTFTKTSMLQETKGILSSRSSTEGTNKKQAGNQGPPKTGLAYLQQLIDEEQKKNDMRPPTKKFMKNYDEKEETDEADEECESLIEEKSRRKKKSLSPGRLPKGYAKTEDEERGHNIPTKRSLKRSFFICPFCKYKSECRETLQMHLESHSHSTLTHDEAISIIKSEPGLHQCLLCLQEFSEKNLLQEHIYNCPTISYEEFSPFNTEKHVCPVCNVVFASRVSLLNHKGYHDEARTFRCSICDYRFYTKKNLEFHSKVHTEGIYKCPYCEYGNSLKKRVINHIHCHTGYKPFKCSMCNYRSTTKNLLERHLLTHDEKRSFHCSECQASFKTKDKLCSHKRLHKKGKPFKCPECGKGFKVPTAMKVHYKIHTEDKPHACPLCPYRARTAAVLRMHSNIHSSEKPFKCHLCDFKANQKSYLSWHIRAYHPKT